MTDKASGDSPKVLNSIKAFLFGGAICCFGQALNELFRMAGLNGDEIKIATPCILIILTAILTGLGVFDKIARHAGAGTIVPITGLCQFRSLPCAGIQAGGSDPRHCRADVYHCRPRYSIRHGKFRYLRADHLYL